MSRVSRRQYETSLKKELLNTQNKYLAAIYARLSFDNSKKHKENIHENSIESQIKLLKSFIYSKSDLNLVKIYIDNDTTGTNFKRKAFKELISDLTESKVNCIVVKDFSRLGRNYIETGEYIEKIFPIMGVRLISVNDGYDSINSAGGVHVPIVNFINEIYARDVSQKTKSIYKVKQERGEYLGSIPPYGYLRDKNNYHKLVIDYKVAFNVKKIYALKASELSDTDIAKILNKSKILPPYKYFYDIGIVKNERYKNNFIWHKSTISRITTNPVYTGSMVQSSGKIVVNNTHDAIIENELFLKVQNIRNSMKHKYCYKENICE